MEIQEVCEVTADHNETLKIEVSVQAIVKKFCMVGLCLNDIQELVFFLCRVKLRHEEIFNICPKVINYWKTRYEDLSIGDLVQAVHGGPVMSIQRIQPKDDGEVECKYEDNGRHIPVTFHYESLRKKM